MTDTEADTGADGGAGRAARAYNPLRSQLVAVLKLVLPFCALALMASVFLLANPIDPERAIPRAEIDVADRARDPRLTGAHFAGVTDDGSALRIEAETARADPQATLRFDASGIVLHLDSPAGDRVFLRADNGMIDRADGHFSLHGDIEMAADPGYQLRTERARGALDRSWIIMPEPLEGLAPAGEISAGSLTVTRAAGAPGGNRLVFSGGVRLIYQPEE